MKVIFSNRAFRQLSRIEKGAQQRIIEKINFYVSLKNPLKFADKLIDFQFGGWRFRVGNYRIIFDFKNDTIIILKIGHRKDVYK